MYKIKINTSSIAAIEKSFASAAEASSCDGLSCSRDCSFGGPNFSCASTETFRSDTSLVLKYLIAHGDRWEEK